MKRQCIVGDCRKKRRAWTVCRFKERGGDVFEGRVDAPMHTMLSLVS